jgi:hypothetical protein
MAKKEHIHEPPRPYTCSHCGEVTMVNCCEVPTRCDECGDKWFYVGVHKLKKFDALQS